jgi:hypothetical protein
MDPFDHEEHNGQAFNGRIEITMINRYPWECFLNPFPD